VAEKADLWLRVRPGGDGALAMSMIHVVLEEKLYDENFVRDWTNGAFCCVKTTINSLRHETSRSGDGKTFFVWDDHINGLAVTAPIRATLRAMSCPRSGVLIRSRWPMGKLSNAARFDQLTCWLHNMRLNGRRR
jgi:anaerobic selenocysteine-containing dehydrogenase